MRINKKINYFIIANILVLISFTGLYAQPLGLTSPQTKQETAQVLCSDAGRYVFGQVSAGSDQFMLDTLTGRLWRVTKSGEVGLYLIKVPYRHEDGKYGPLPEDISPFRKK